MSVLFIVKHARLFALLALILLPCCGGDLYPFIEDCPCGDCTCGCLDGDVECDGGE